MTTLMPKPNTTIAYTDGACKGNPGAGGWGAYLIFADGHTQELYAGEANTTNNRMEMMATIHAIEYASQHNQNNHLTHKLELWTDSSYVKKGITEWVAGWKKKGWKTANKKPVKNQDLWQRLDALNQAHHVEWHWIKGHAGHAGNEKADELANQGVIDPAGNLSAQVNPAQDDWLESDVLGLDAETDQIELEETELENLENTELAETVLEQSALEASVLETSMSKDGQSATEAFDAQVAEPEFPAFDGDTSRANPHFRPLLPKPINQGRNNRQLIMDTETTGFEFNNGDRIIEVGIVEMVGRKFTGEKLHVYINPNRTEPMSEETIRVHGITDDFLADKPTFDKVAQQIYDFMIGAEVIAHNATFDMNFLNMEFARVGLGDFASKVTVTDSLAIAKHQYPGQRNSLDALVRRLNVGKQDRTFHGALLDSEILAEVYLTMTGGQVSLAIDEDGGIDGDIQHTHFENMAQMLVADQHNDLSHHQQWLENISSKFPAVKEVWEIVETPEPEPEPEQILEQESVQSPVTGDDCGTLSLF